MSYTNRTVPRLMMRVWDAPTRLFHWAIVVLIAVSYVSVKYSWMQIHFLSGYAVLALLLFRVAWGFVGSETSRFRQFLRSPVAGLQHLATFAGKREPDTEIGHNAAGGWMVLALLLLLLVQAGTGLFANHEPGFTYDAHGPLALAVQDRTSAWLTGIHHLNFNLILAAIALHVLAVAAYQVVKGHNLVGPMITGIKALPVRAAAPRMGSPVLAAVFLAAAAVAVWGITRLG